jgi:acyl phosphate:glycerol-3-phosphate acyltransferase
MVLNISLVIIAYLFGSLSAAVIVCKVMHLDDPRKHGSKNPGTTNVLRLHGKKAAALTLIGDLIKGLLPVLLARTLEAPELVVALSALAAFCGHIFPVFFNFQGGKGVAILIGVLLGMHWLLGTAFILGWILIALLFRYSSLAALSAAAVLPVFAVLLQTPIYYIASIVIMTTLLFWRHRSNIRNLIAGKEDKIGSNKI